MDDMYKRYYGDKYDTSLGIKDIAKLVRADIKTAVKEKRIVDGKYSVRIERYSGGCALHVYLKNCKVNMLNVWAVKFSEESPYVNSGRMPKEHPAYGRYTPFVTKTFEELKDICDAYNHDGSNSMIDYFDVNFYAHIGIWWEDESAERDMLIEKSKTLEWPKAWKNYFEIEDFRNL